MLIDATTESLHPLEQIFFELKYSPTIEMAANLHAMECPKHFPSQKDRVDATRAKMGPDLRSEFNYIARETLGFAPVMDLIDHLERSDIDNIALFLDRLADVDPVEFAYGYFSGLIPKRTIRALLKDPQARIPEGEALGHYFPEKSLRAYFEIQDELRPRIASFLKAYWTDVFAREWDHIGAVEIRRLSEEKHALAAIGHRAYLAGCHAGISVDDDAVRLQKSMGFTIPYRSIKKVEIVISAYVRPHLMMNCFDDVLTIYKGVDMAISDRETSFAEVEKFVKAISSVTKLKILFELNRQEQTTKELAERFDVASSSISEHLKALREAELVYPQRVQNQVYYRFLHENYDAQLTYLKDAFRER